MTIGQPRHTGMAEEMAAKHQAGALALPSTVQRYVNGFMFDAEGTRVALVRKLRPSWQNGLLNGIGGKIEPGESALIAMNREFREEAGIDYMDWQPFVKLYRPGVYEVFFYSTRTDRVLEAMSMTDEPIGLYALSELPGRADTVPNLRWLVPMAADPCLGRGDFIPVPDTKGD